jgi:hypothetical protein
MAMAAARAALLLALACAVAAAPPPDRDVITVLAAAAGGGRVASLDAAGDFTVLGAVAGGGGAASLAAPAAAPHGLVAVAASLNAAVASCNSTALRELLASLEAQREPCVSGGGNADNLTDLVKSGVRPALPAWIPCLIAPSSQDPHAVGLEYGPRSVWPRSRRLVLSPEEAVALLIIESLPHLAAASLCASSWTLLKGAGWLMGDVPLVPSTGAMTKCDNMTLPSPYYPRSVWRMEHYNTILSPQFLWCVAAPALSADVLVTLASRFGARAVALALAVNGDDVTTVAMLDAILCSSGARGSSRCDLGAMNAWLDEWIDNDVSNTASSTPATHETLLLRAVRTDKFDLAAFLVENGADVVSYADYKPFRAASHSLFSKSVSYESYLSTPSPLHTAAALCNASFKMFELLDLAAQRRFRNEGDIDPRQVRSRGPVPGATFSPSSNLTVAELVPVGSACDKYLRQREGVLNLVSCFAARSAPQGACALCALARVWIMR